MDPAEEAVVDEDRTPVDEILDTDRILGDDKAERAGTANRAPARANPTTGALPQTGAPELLALQSFAGLLMVLAGAIALRRRRAS